jgi:hypothetical protein
MKKSYSVTGKSVGNYTVGSRNKVIDYINVFFSGKKFSFELISAFRLVS